MNDKIKLQEKFESQAQEIITEEIFYQHKNQLFIVGENGKPVFSRYGDETKMSTLLGAFSALVSLTIEDGKEIEIEGDTKRIFIDIRGPFIFISMNNKDKSISEIRRYHEFIEHLIYLYIPLDIFEKKLEENPAFDCRQLTSSKTKEIKMGIYQFNTWIGGMIGKVEIEYCSIRQSIGNSISNIVTEGNIGIKNNIIMVLLYNEKKIISCNGKKGFSLTPNDMNGIISYGNENEGDGEVGMPELSKSGKLKIWTINIGVLKMAVIYQTEDYFLEVKIITENINQEIDHYYNTLIASINNPPVPDLYTNHLLLFYTFIGDNFIYSSPLNDLYKDRKQEKRIKSLCTKLYYEHKEFNTDNLSSSKRCAFTTDLETVAFKQTQKGLLIGIFNFIVDIPSSIDYLNQLDKWFNYDNITYTQYDLS
ncbi:hypothetical protein EHI8A_051870 [Entamoeba histolytica HM-1:IMSS-B]|uniref:FUZ/MON1/HPS1 first Longin domain-containing protein n=2 Tax=Entamoeba histolytica (strain ATCC 30459 / HM-1:IMSS / ABRM) TaxID=294381 RepID=M3UQC5_ENTH1|nr:hypothetical protein EHI8A_051870 [Entamoeba histolytica HM-1:IMSS-B]ENY62900.1 protein SAND, putative [Entamoeba histolytica HM-1:IMSS-A]